MNKVKLTKEGKELIRKWLTLHDIDKKGNCPLLTTYCEICYSWFPRATSCNCPCFVYSLRYVVKVARKMIKEEGVKVNG